MEDDEDDAKVNKFDVDGIVVIDVDREDGPEDGVNYKKNKQS